MSDFLGYKMCVRNKINSLVSKVKGAKGPGAKKKKELGYDLVKCSQKNKLNALVSQGRGAEGPRALCF